MEIKKGTVEKLGSCNYCNTGELSLGGTNLIYPYQDVFEIKGNYIASNICEQCAEKLSTKLSLNSDEDLNAELVKITLSKDTVLSLLGVLVITKDSYANTGNESIISMIKEVQQTLKNSILKK